MHQTRSAPPTTTKARITFVPSCLRGLRVVQFMPTAPATGLAFLALLLLQLGDEHIRGQCQTNRTGGVQQSGLGDLRGVDDPILSMSPNSPVAAFQP
jgi:hypothetical protein